MKKRIPQMMTMAFVMALVFGWTFDVCAMEEESIRTRADIGKSDNGAYIIVEKKSGELEAYSLEEMFGDVRVISCDEVTEAAHRAYITDCTDTAATDSMRSALAKYTFDWDIDRNTIVYSTQKLNLDVYDKIYVSVTANTSNYVSYEIGLMNNVNDVFSCCNNVVGSIGSPQEITDTWEMAVGGSFSFAIKNCSGSADKTVNFTGSYRL
ncbi:MAG: hypothetical protein NC399_09260 [Muribaculum sp.]|nr:hypothetical protein [Muribaculum sp.]